MKQNTYSSYKPLFSRAVFKKLPVSILGVAISGLAIAQDVEQDSVSVDVPSPIEEVLVLGRLKNAAESLSIERMESNVVVDLLGADQMSRVGDSNIAVALKRVPGITLIGGKFIYVRGLGERYSSTLLNGATVPSPDLTRNVLPLDIFPTSIVESVAIQKAYSPDLPGAFGGGNINIRTKGIPDQLVANFEVSTGLNTDSDRVLSYKGGSDDKYGKDDGTRALAPEIDRALRLYRSDFNAPEPSLSASAIQNTFDELGSPISAAQAAEENAQLATYIYRDLSIYEKDESLNDIGVSGSLGNAYYIGDDWELGAIAAFKYDTSTRTDSRIARTIDSPDEEFSDELRTTDNVSITGSFNAGLSKGEDHSIELKNIFLRNTDDEVGIRNIFNTTSPFSGGRGSRNYQYRFEQRELKVNQLTGEHTLGYETRDLLGMKEGIWDDLKIEWFYSDSVSKTDIPSETTLQASITTDVNTGLVTATRLRPLSRLANIRYSELRDDVKSSGAKFILPLSFQDFDMEFSLGNKYDRQSRTFSQLDLSFGTTKLQASDSLSGDISDALSDENLLNSEFGYSTSYQSGLSRSYIAARTIDAIYGNLDITWRDTWKVSLGSRYEKFQQFSAPWQPYRRRGSPLRLNFSDANENQQPDGIFAENDAYNALSLTYMTPGFGAEDFQLRFAFSNTVVRPDLREVSDAEYLDPVTDSLVSGNPDVIPSDLTNFDIRAEWYFSNGDTLTASLFHKDIDNPIEYYQVPGAEDSIISKIQNADTGETQGIEIEWLKSLDFMGGFASQFYAAGNVTLAESSIDIGDDLIVAATNPERPLSGASDYVVNLQFGYDSDNGQHAATLVYNVFGERVFTAGINDFDDAYEQPVNALDLTYSYFPTDNITVKFKARNLLDEDTVIQQSPRPNVNVDSFERTAGQTFGLSVSYKY